MKNYPVLTYTIHDIAELLDVGVRRAQQLAKQHNLLDRNDPVESFRRLGRLYKDRQVRLNKKGFDN